MLPAALAMVAWEVAKMPARVYCRTLGGAVVFSQQLNKPQNIIFRKLIQLLGKWGSAGGW